MRRRVGLRIVLLAALLALVGTHVSAAPTPGTVHFSAAGDYASTPNTTAVLNAIHGRGDDLTLALGDFSYATTGLEQTWCDFITSKLGADFPFELVAGNHESDGLNGNIDAFAFCLPNRLSGLVGTYGRQYYVDVPAVNPLVRYIMISPGLTFPNNDVYTYNAGSARYQWTAQAIDGARSASIPWVVVGMHKPCLTVGKYACDVGSDLLNLLVGKKVDLVLSGHEHTYQRTKQLSQGVGCGALAPGSYNPSCVVDSDSTLVRGAGTVALVVGTGGNSLYDINAADPEMSYFAATSGANLNRAWGFLDVSATQDSLQASFVPAIGGTFTDSFTISRATGTPNQPPVAAFTSSCTGLACGLNAAGSSDPDGTISSYAWSFGDTSTGTGSAPSHTYAMPGTYTIGLTVTDDDGQSTTTTRPVTVSSPGVTVYASDQFSRTVSSGLGTAPTGGGWTAEPVTSFSVGNGLGNIRLAAGAGRTAYLAGVSAPGTDLRLSFGSDKQATGSGLYLTALGRRVQSAGSYGGKVKIDSSGGVSLSLVRLSASGAEFPLLTGVTIGGLKQVVGDTLNLRLQVTGASSTTIRAKVWKKGTAEPATWQRSIADSTAGMGVPGAVGVAAYLSSGATNAPVTVTLDDLTVTSP